MQSSPFNAVQLKSAAALAVQQPRDSVLDLRMAKEIYACASFDFKSYADFKIIE